MSDDRPRSLLVATDLTPACDEILRAAGELASHTGAELHVIHVLEAGGLFESEAAAEARRTEAHEELERQLARTLPAGAEATRSLRSGLVYRELEAAAEELGSDLFVLGAHGGPAAGAHFLGSTADRVLRTSRIPCLVVRGALRLPLRRIGVPVDLSDPSFGALRLAVRWAPGLTGRGEGEAASVRLLHVGWPVTQVDVPDYEEATVRPRIAEEIAAATAATKGNVTTEIDVHWDYLAGQRICLWAYQREIGLLVVGTHGRSGLPRALLGSVATRLAREAPCSVLLVPPDATP